jgi:putative MFS transporter
MSASTTTTGTAAAIDNMSWRPFHFKMAAFVGGGQFIDGYVLGVIALGLFLMPADFGLTPFWRGLIGSSALVGLFVGAIIGGWLTDRFGRVRLYTADLLVFLIGSIAQLFVTTPLELYLIRLVMGLAIGVDYAVGPTYLAEFLPKKGRGRVLGGGLVFMWDIGFSLSLLIGVLGRGWGPGAWRWVLASSAIPALIVLLLRLGSPESPRWLVLKGRLDEAAAVCKKFLPGVSVNDLLAEKTVRASFREVLKGEWLKRVIFVGTFWSALAWPSFAISTFLPQVLQTLGFERPDIGSLILRSLPILGLAFGVIMMANWGRRPILIWALSLQTAIFVVLALYPNPSGLLAAALIGGWFIVLGFASVVEFLYAPEIFPTEVRGWGVGLGSAGSRVGAAAGTFLLPLLLAGPGLQFAMGVTAVISVVGVIVTVMWAPETRNVPLLEAGSTGESRVSASAAAGGTKGAL